MTREEPTFVSYGHVPFVQLHLLKTEANIPAG